MRVALLFFCLMALSLPAGNAAESPFSEDEPLRPLTLPPGLDADKVNLGRKLFLDPALSADGTVSCSTCHNLAAGGADHQPLPTGIRGGHPSVRAPTIYNSGLNFIHHWDSRRGSLEEITDSILTSPVGMGASWPDVVAKLKADAAYNQAFRRLFGTAPTREAVLGAIATFERSLVAIDSPFDRYLRGDKTALSDQERDGYELFKSYGCVACHQGANVGGNMFQKFGFMGNLFTDRGKINPPDLGRFNVTHDEADRFVFKVPSLRLAAVNGPYFHDGSVATLPEAIRIMGHYQLGREIPETDVKAITAFLGSLVGKLDQP